MQPTYSSFSILEFEYDFVQNVVLVNGTKQLCSRNSFEFLKSVLKKNLCSFIVIISNSCNTGMSALPDMHAQRPRARSA